MQDDVFGETPDVFAEVESDPEPAADPLAEPTPGVEEADLGGDNPSEQVPDGPFLEEPEEPEAELDMEAELPGEEEALAAAAAAEPPPQAADPLAAEEPPADPLAEEPVAEPEPEPEPAAAEPAAAEPEPEPQAAAEPEPPAEAKAKPGKKKASKKPAKKSAAKKDSNGTAPAPKKSERDYVVLYQVEGGAYAVGPTISSRTTSAALEKAFDQLSPELGVTAFSNMVAVPASNWKPEPVEGETESVSRVRVGR